MTVNQVARLTGVTVRTLHHYDKIDLLKPAAITDSGYRKYGEEELKTLEQILFFRELDFSLEDIKNILSDPKFDSTKALLKHKELLELKRQRLDKLINLVDDTLKGEIDMSFKAFDMEEINQLKEEYAKETKEKYSESDAYKESVRKTKNYSQSDWNKILEEQEHIYKELAKHIGSDPASEKVQELVQRWREYITRYYYDCTLEIFEGLGQMYVADKRFTDNIDRYGVGLAQLLSDAIGVYVADKL